MVKYCNYFIFIIYVKIKTNKFIKKSYTIGA